MNLVVLIATFFIAFAQAAPGNGKFNRFTFKKQEHFHIMRYF
jgi:hypothetical protein